MFAAFVSSRLACKRSLWTLCLLARRPLSTKYMITRHSKLVASKDFTKCGVTSVSRELHTSSAKPALPAIVLAVLKPASRLAAILLGRRLRIWYRNLSEEEQRKVINRVKKNQHLILGKLKAKNDKKWQDLLKED